MTRRAPVRLAMSGAAILLAALVALAWLAFRRDLGEAHARVASGSLLAATRCGPIEYAQAGSGPAVLLVHGAGGGFDQVLDVADELAKSGFRAIAVSRFGYLRTPLPADASPQAQADAHACLLDALGIRRAAIVGVSAGAPSSMQFALRHPQRCDALFLLVPLAYAPRPALELSAAQRFMFEQGIRSDLLYWLALRLAPTLVTRTVLATPPEVVAQADAAERKRVQQVAERILPLSRRQAGLRNDAAIAATLGRYDLERIAAPTMVLSVADDLYGTYGSAGYTAANVPGSHFIGYARGGHAWVGRHAEVMGELKAFLVAPRERLEGYHFIWHL